MCQTLQGTRTKCEQGEKANENIFEERTETKHCTNTAKTVQSVKDKHNNGQHTHMPYTNVIYVLTVI